MAYSWDFVFMSAVTVNFSTMPMDCPIKNKKEKYVI